MLFINIFFLYAQKYETLKGKVFYNYGGEISWNFISDSIVEISEYTEREGRKTTKIKYLYQKNEPYYNLILKDNEKETKYLALLGPYDDFFLLYEEPKRAPINNGFFGMNSSFYASKVKYISDNYLTEGKNQYLPENLKDKSIGMPWVEGGDGAGIGSHILIENSRTITNLIISNGFVSFKPTTYFNNNRLKRIRIVNAEEKSQKIEIELEDNAVPVGIKLPFSAKKIDLEILDVYKGEKYDDTCINFILCKNDY